MNRNEEMGRGPYRRRCMTDLTDADLKCIRVWAQAELDGVISGQGRCEYKKHRDYLWGVIKVQDSGYAWWAERDYRETVREVDSLLASRTEEQRRRQQAREHAERLAIAQAGGEPLFTPKEQREIEEHDLLQVIEDCYSEGRRKLVRTHHPDKGGDPKIMLALNLSETVAAKLFAEMRKQLKGES